MNILGITKKKSWQARLVVAFIAGKCSIPKKSRIGLKKGKEQRNAHIVSLIQL